MLKTDEEIIAALEAVMADQELDDASKRGVRRALGYMLGEHSEIRVVMDDADDLRVASGVARHDGLPEAEALWRAYLAIADIFDEEVES